MAKSVGEPASRKATSNSTSVPREPTSTESIWQSKRSSRPGLLLGADPSARYRPSYARASLFLVLLCARSRCRRAKAVARALRRRVSLGVRGCIAPASRWDAGVDLLDGASAEVQAEHGLHCGSTLRSGYASAPHGRCIEVSQAILSVAPDAALQLATRCLTAQVSARAISTSLRSGSSARRLARRRRWSLRRPSLRKIPPPSRWTTRWIEGWSGAGREAVGRAAFGDRSQAAATRWSKGG